MVSAMGSMQAPAHLFAMTCWGAAFRLTIWRLWHSHLTLYRLVIFPQHLNRLSTAVSRQVSAHEETHANLFASVLRSIMLRRICAGQSVLQ